MDLMPDKECTELTAFMPCFVFLFSSVREAAFLMGA